MHRYVQDIASIVPQAEAAIEQGNPSLLGALMAQAQRSFDTAAVPNCPSQLTSPVLHALMQDVVLVGSSHAHCSGFEHERHQEQVEPRAKHADISSLALAVKGIGSQGDGSAQVSTSE